MDVGCGSARKLMFSPPTEHRPTFTQLSEDLMLTQARLKERVIYNPDTGEFTWRINWNRSRAGERITARRGDGKQYFGSNMAFLYMTGRMPTMDMDHRNGDTSDDRWCNLREVTHQVNQQNRTRPNKNNKHGFLGVTPNGGGWAACLWVNGKHKHLGTYPTPQEAHQVYLKAKRELHEGCTI